ncbi:hypothetical protein IHE44_0004811 [Lamprotornis superbus]|uniref:Transcription factor RFX3 n=1 Tax=Lamprotornis superbus TaxID=245042 RepID=A0A835TQC3_9PASS|nr:hypothetical protein IHE44_0004811 [Lamprotornis superbus]
MMGVGDRGRPEKERWDRGLGSLALALLLAGGVEGRRPELLSSVLLAIPAPGATFPAFGHCSAAFPLHPTTSGHSAEHHDRHREEGVAPPSLSHLDHHSSPLQLRGTALPTAPVQQVQTVQQVHVYPAQVQYVEGSDTVYTNGTIRTTYPYTETQMYSQNTGGNYFEGGSAQATTVVSSHSMVGTGGIQMGVAGGQLISNSGGTYLIGNSMENSGHSVTHTTRASPATIEMAIETLQKSDGLSTHRSSLLNSHLQWLLDNYETAEGVSLPRSTLYNHYLRHCQEHKLDPVNAASFGKLIRSIFMGLRTRRLGTRGNSKYHYYGIRVKPDSPLNRLQEDMQYMAMRQQPTQQKQRYKPVQKVDGVPDGFTGSGQQTGTSAEQTIIAQSQHHQQFLDASRVLPEFGEVEISSLPDGTTLEDIKSLQSLYREHCEAIVDVIVNLQFSLIEKLWQTFWRYSPSAPPDGTPSILKWMGNCDHVMYQALVEILIPDVLRPIPSKLNTDNLS